MFSYFQKTIAKAEKAGFQPLSWEIPGVLIRAIRNSTFLSRAELENPCNKQELCGLPVSVVNNSQPVRLLVVPRVIPQSLPLED